MPPSGPAVEPAAALLRKLGHHVRLDQADQQGVARLLSRSVRRLSPRAALVEAGEVAGELHVVVDGWIAREMRLPDGRRRITGFSLPGDVCDFGALVMGALDGGLAAVGDAAVASIARGGLNELSHAHPRAARALWWESTMTAAIQRAWTVNVGRRSARDRLAFLFSELHFRLSLVGLAAGGRIAMPATQGDLGDACGLTSIHTNRALQEMRRDGAIVLADGQLVVTDPDALAREGGFDPSYLPIASLRRAPVDAEAPPVAPA